MLAMTLGGHGEWGSTPARVWAAVNAGLSVGLVAFALWLDARYGLSAPGLALAVYVLARLQGRNEANALRDRDYQGALKVAAAWTGIPLGTDDRRERQLRRDLGHAFRVHQLPAARHFQEDSDERGDG